MVSYTDEQYTLAHVFMPNIKGVQFNGYILKPICYYSLNTVSEIQKPWKTLREQFVREVRLKKKSGDGAKSPVPWELFSLMEFIRDFVKHRK